MKKIFTLLLITITMQAYAQWDGAGYYRVHNAASNKTYAGQRYLSVKGGKSNVSINNTTPSAFYECIKMVGLLSTDDYITDPSTVVYINSLSSATFYCQGMNTQSITGYTYTVEETGVEDNNITTYQIYKKILFYTFYLQDYNGCDIGKNAGSSNVYARWWLEPLKEGSDYYFAVKPVNESTIDPEGYYWTTLVCDFPCKIPTDGGVEGAYTINEITTVGETNKAIPTKVYAQGETIPAGTPVMLRLSSKESADCKLIPTGSVGNKTSFPLTNGLLKGNYFGPYENYFAEKKDSIKTYDAVNSNSKSLSTTNDQETMRVLGTNSEGTIGFFKYKGYSDEFNKMNGNKCWLDISSLSGAKAGVIEIDFENMIDETTGISSVNDDSRKVAREGIYDLSGRRIEKPTTKGIYIINGRKVVIK